MEVTELSPPGTDDKPGDRNEKRPGSGGLARRLGLLTQISSRLPSDKMKPTPLTVLGPLRHVSAAAAFLRRPARRVSRSGTGNRRQLSPTFLPDARRETEAPLRAGTPARWARLRSAGSIRRVRGASVTSGPARKWRGRKIGEVGKQRRRRSGV